SLLQALERVADSDNALERVADSDNVRIAVLCPDHRLAEKGAVPEQMPELKVLVETHSKFLAQRHGASSACDYLGVVPLQYGVSAPSTLENTRSVMRGLMAHSDRTAALEAAHEADLHSGENLEENGTDTRHGVDSGDLDDDSYSLLEVVHSVAPSPATAMGIYDLVYAKPVSTWAEAPIDISALSPAAKRTMIFSLLVEYANQENIRQADCHFVTALVPPISLNMDRPVPVIQMQVRMHGFRMSSDQKYPVVASHRMPEVDATVYIHVGSDKARGNDTNSEMSIESSLSALSLQHSSGMVHLSHLKALGSVTGLGGQPQAHIPVLLGSRRLGNVTLDDRVGADHWISIGAYFEIL
ncbi:hypothetical protein KIPB_004653, partial [Kipferlia bialata]